jgi:hypothetical protein
MTALLTHLPRVRYTVSAEQRRALQILAVAGLLGCTGASHGFSIGMLADLVRNGLATARRETMKVGKREIIVARVWIAEAGQRAIGSE